MRRATSVFSRLMLLVVPLLLSGCCSWCRPVEDGKLAGEPPFPVRPKGPGPMYILGTADFSAGSVVQVKLQVNAVTQTGLANEAIIQAWSGSGPAPLHGDLPFTSEPNVYDSGGDVDLPHWTIHMNRDRNPSVDGYWIVLKLNRLGSGNNGRQITWFMQHWDTDTDPNDDPPDAPDEFTLYDPQPPP